MGIVLMLVFIGGMIFLLRSTMRSDKKEMPVINATQIERLLEEEVDFYKKIQTSARKENFKQRVIRFIQHVRFTDVGKAKHHLLDEVLIASSAIMPLFSYPDWEYKNIREILLYDDHFDGNYQTDEKKSYHGYGG